METMDSGGKQPQRIRFTPDGKEVWVSHVAADTLTVIDANSRKVVANAAVASGRRASCSRPTGTAAISRFRARIRLPSSMCRVASLLRTSRRAWTRTA